MGVLFPREFDEGENYIVSLVQDIALKKKEGKMSYFKRLSKWLASEEWKIYEQALNESNFDSLSDDGGLGYGCELE